MFNPASPRCLRELAALRSRPRRKRRGSAIAIVAYFDAATHDLVRIDWKEQQFHFSHPVAVDGTRVPSRCVLLGENGKERIRTELRDIQRLAEVPAELAPKAR